MTDNPAEMLRVRTADGFEINVSRAVAEAPDSGVTILEETPYRTDGKFRAARAPGDPAERAEGWEGFSVEELRNEIDLRNHRGAGLSKSGSKATLLAAIKRNDDQLLGRRPEAVDTPPATSADTDSDSDG